MKKSKILWLVWIFSAIALFLFFFVSFKGFWLPLPIAQQGSASGPQAVLDNYGNDIQKFAPTFKIPVEFAEALCLLESGGRKPVPSRYEKNVYLKLKMVKLGIRKQYENVEYKHLEDANDDAIQNMASSWGPFQLMGYKCVYYNINIQELRGDSSVYWALKWMSENYGDYIAQKDYKSAFHIHNTGMPFPADNKSRTYNPNYVDEGLKWMKYFKKKRP